MASHLQHGFRERSFRHRGYLVIGVLALCAAGCGRGSAPEVEDARVARLPAEDREALLEEQRDLDRINANLDTTQVALEEAEQFKEIVESEQGAAEQRLEAAQQATELAESAQDRGSLDEAQAREQSAQTQVEVIEAKSGYAEALVELREAQLSEIEAERGYAEARLQRARFEHLAARDMQNDLDREDFIEAEQQARQQWEEARGRTASLEAQVESQAQRWNALRQQGEANGNGAAPPIEPPEPPQLIEASQEPAEPREEPAPPAQPEATDPEGGQPEGEQPGGF